MPLTEKERAQQIKQFIETLKPHVTGFSQSFQMHGKQRDEVTCGGRVKYVVDTGKMHDNLNDRIVYVTLDDEVGEILIVIPSIFWDNLHAKIGDIVIARGVLYSPEKECTFESKAGGIIKIIRENDPFRVLVKSIYKL
ncbi:DNA-binding protein [Priestia sp. YIM B13551]|uniref:DNA-binding protein n=1 Tax=Priestia sp. YIM B13551 TaxID=3366306 RepID=UPI00367326BD